MTDPDQIGITTRQLLQELALAQAEYDAWHGVCQTAGIDPAMRVDYVDELVIRERLARASDALARHVLQHSDTILNEPLTTRCEHVRTACA